ncbi:YheU family protein [Endozoicomonas sp. Mp262]|uniref:YheU family protein n=1 Tax=Endozoicomonas sp. Mp262 TaxID=2919499 RepID=UPI0021D81E42
MIIPYQMLEKETLNSLIEEYVSRDGTDNGFDQDLTSRVAMVMKQLATEEAVIVFDSESQTANIVCKKDLGSKL